MICANKPPDPIDASVGVPSSGTGPKIGLGGDPSVVEAMEMVFRNRHGFEPGGRFEITETMHKLVYSRDQRRIVEDEVADHLHTYCDAYAEVAWGKSGAKIYSRAGTPFLAPVEQFEPVREHFQRLDRKMRARGEQIDVSLQWMLVDWEEKLACVIIGCVAGKTPARVRAVERAIPGRVEWPRSAKDAADVLRCLSVTNRNK